MSVIKKNDAISQKHLHGRSYTLQVSKHRCQNGTKTYWNIHATLSFFGQTQNIHIPFFKISVMKIDDTSRHPSLRASLKSALQTGPSITAGDLTDFKGWERFRSIYQRAAPSLPSQAPNVEDDFHLQTFTADIALMFGLFLSVEWEWVMSLLVCQCRDGCRAGRHRRQPLWVLIRSCR